MMNTTRISILLAAVSALACTPVLAADMAAAQAKVKEVCQACHGLDGNSQSPDYPRLGGQHADYLARALHEYKSGARKNAIMNGFAATLSDQDIDNLAAYFAAQPQVLHTNP